MATLTRRFIMLSLVIAIFAMLLAAAVANQDQENWVSAVRFCASAEGPDCLLGRN